LSDNSGTNAFTNGPNGGVYGNANLTPSEGDKDDWQSMTWSQIEAAILGASEISSSNTDTGSGVASPTTLQAAADVFYNVQQTLASVAQDLVQQANLLAGEDGSPWQGPAAQSFMAMIKTFANDISSNASLLQDAAGNSVPDQLINNANTLAWAQSEVQYIDSYWANIATQEGAQTINGLVQVHEVPSIPPLMTSDMKQVMSTLVSNYSNNVYPTPLPPQTVSPNGSTNLNSNLNQNSPNLNFNAPNFQAPNYPNINIPNISMPNTGSPNLNTNIPNTDGPNLSTPNSLGIGSPNLTGSPNLGGNVPTDDFATTGNPNLSGSPNLSSPNLGSPNLAADNLGPAGLGPAGLTGSPNLADDAALSPAGLVGSPNLGGAPNLDEADEQPDFSALNPSMDDALNPSGLTGSPNLASSDPLAAEEGLPNAEDLATSPDLTSPSLTSPGDETMPMMPGMGSGAGSGAGLSSTDPSDASGLLSNTDPFSGDLPLTSDDLGSLSGAAPGLTSANDGEGMPIMPGMGSGAGAGAGLGSTDPSDASGLLSNTDPFSGTSPLTSDELGSDTGAAPGLTSAEGGESMPFMPGMGSGAGAGQTLTSTDPSDASGLLSNTDPFSGESPLASDELGSETGAVPGLSPEGETVGSDGMPFMPGMGSGAGAGQALGATDPSDASGLLEREGTPWAEEGLPGEDELGSDTGAAPGLTSAEGGESMPFMPGMGAGAGAGQALGATDPSDASGLLGTDGEPWAEPETTAGDEIGSADGASAAAEPAESEPAEEMPMMPGMGAGQPGSQNGDERSDASGLLLAETQPWTEGVEHSEEIGASNGAIAVGAAAAEAAAAAAALLGAGAALAAASPAEQEQAVAEESAAAEPVAEGEEEYEYDAFDEEDGAEHEHDGNRIPVIGADAADDDLSGWDLAGAAADAALFTLGAWANRRRDEDDETFARIVSTEQEAWLGEDADLPNAGEDADGLPAATWRPNRDFSGGGESRPMSGAGTMMRSAPPPKDYDPVAAAEAAAAAAEAEEAERQAALEAEEEEKRKRAPADLLTQDPDMWGSPKTDWDAL
jgi:hypothetical protein